MDRQYSDEMLFGEDDHVAHAGGNPSTTGAGQHAPSTITEAGQGLNAVVPGAEGDAAGSNDDNPFSGDDDSVADNSQARQGLAGDADQQMNDENEQDVESADYGDEDDDVDDDNEVEEEEGEQEIAEEEGEEEQVDADDQPEEGEEEIEELQSVQDIAKAKGDVEGQGKGTAMADAKEQRNRGLLDEEEDEDSLGEEDDILSSGGEDDLLKRHQKQKKQKSSTSQPNDSAQQAQAQLDKPDQTASSLVPNAQNSTSLPRKRGRPSKKALLEQEQFQRESRLQKRVRFENGDQVTYNKESAGEDSEEARAGADAGDEKSMGAGSRQQAEDVSGYRRNLGDFDEYVKMMNDEHISSAFEVFTQKRRKHVYESLVNEQEEERFNAYIEACPKKPMRKKLNDLIEQLPGQKLKIPEVVYQVITSAVKSHSGQLVEMAKKIQIEEIKQKLALQYPHKKLQDKNTGQLVEGKEFLISGQCLSKEAQEAYVQEIRDMGPSLPHHLQEARRRMNSTEVAVNDRPKSMFLRKRFR